jgi:hypothetical protein
LHFNIEEITDSFERMVGCAPAKGVVEIPEPMQEGASGEPACPAHNG